MTGTRRRKEARLFKCHRAETKVRSGRDLHSSSPGADVAQRGEVASPRLLRKAQSSLPHGSSYQEQPMVTFPVLNGPYAVFVFLGQEPSSPISNDPLGLLDLHLPGMLEGKIILESSQCLLRPTPPPIFLCWSCIRHLGLDLVPRHEPEPPYRLLGTLQPPAHLP